MSIINARSPFIVTIDVPFQTGSKVELFLWNGLGVAPTLPTYVFSKDIPSPTIETTTYNISDYVLEFIKHDSYAGNLFNTNSVTPISEWCNVIVKRYSIAGATTTLISTAQYFGFDGFGYYEQGVNSNNGVVLLDAKKYTYWSNPLSTFAAEPLKRPGQITVLAQKDWFVQYTGLITGNSLIIALLDTPVQDFPRVHTSMLSEGCKTEIFNQLGVLQWTGIFQPKTECKYDPVVVDFINRSGAWQREVFFKVSKNTMQVNSSQYNLLQTNLPSWSVTEGQRKVFNTSGAESIKVNSDWVKENYSENIKQLMLSERILVNNRPAKLQTTQIELFKHINMRMINYELTFDFANDMINSVV